MIETAVEMDDLAFEFADRTLWTGLQRTVRAGQLIALRGESGAGKTTLLQCLGSLMRPTGGALWVYGANVIGLRGREKRDYLRNSVGFLFQNAGLVASWTVRKNLAVGGITRNVTSSEVGDTCERFLLARSLLDTPVYRLSGGEQQRVGAIRLALQDPQLLLMDEPTSALDDENAAHLLGFVSERCRRGRTAIIATHDPRVLAHADGVIDL